MDFVQEPVMPLMFLLHERKLTAHHSCLFKHLRDQCGHLNNVPILIDMEPGIRNAISEQTGMKIIGCWRHLKKDIEAWVSKHGGYTADKNVYVDDVLKLMKIGDEDLYHTELDTKKKRWSQPFVDYFEKQLQKRMQYYVAWNIQVQLS